MWLQQRFATEAIWQSSKGYPPGPHWRWLGTAEEQLQYPLSYACAWEGLAAVATASWDCMQERLILDKLPLPVVTGVVRTDFPGFTLFLLCHTTLDIHEMTKAALLSTEHMEWLPALQQNSWSATTWEQIRNFKSTFTIPLMVSLPGSLWKYQAWSLSRLEQGAEERGRWAPGLSIPFWSPDQPAWQAECLFHLSEPRWAESAESRRDVNSWSMITQQKNLFLSLPIETFQLLLQRSHISLYLKQQPLGWVENRIMWGITCLTAVPFSRPLLSLLSHSLCSQLVRFSLATAKLRSHILSAGGHCLPGVPLDVPTLWHPGVYPGAVCPPPLRQLSRGYWTLGHLIVLEVEWYWAPQDLSPSRFEMGIELNFVPFMAVNQ